MKPHYNENRDKNWFDLEQFCEDRNAVSAASTYRLNQSNHIKYW